MIVLDTHVWFWWIVSPDRLSNKALAEVESATQIGLSSYSTYELARAQATGRAELDRPDWIERARRCDPRLVEIPVDSAIAMRSVELLRRGLTGDPGDQIILATAELAAARLVTIDRRIRKFAPDQTIW